MTPREPLTCTPEAVAFQRVLRDAYAIEKFEHRVTFSFHSYQRADDLLIEWHKWRASLSARIPSGEKKDV